LLRAQVILAGDFGIPDADQGLPPIAGENVRDSPDREADHQQADQNHAERSGRPLAQCIECHAENLPFSIAKAALASDAWTGSRGGGIIGS